MIEIKSTTQYTTQQLKIITGANVNQLCGIQTAADFNPAVHLPMAQTVIGCLHFWLKPTQKLEYSFPSEPEQNIMPVIFQGGIVWLKVDPVEDETEIDPRVTHHFTGRYIATMVQKKPDVTNLVFIPYKHGEIERKRIKPPTTWIEYSFTQLEDEPVFEPLAIYKDVPYLKTYLFGVFSFHKRRNESLWQKP